MKRKLFNLASAFSLLLCAATLALWTSSYRTSESLVVGWHTSSNDSQSWTDLRMTSAGGVLHLVRWTKSQATGTAAVRPVDPRAAPERIPPRAVVVVSIKDVAGPGVTSGYPCRLDSAGNIQLPEVGKIRAVGLTADELAAAVRRAYLDSVGLHIDLSVSVTIPPEVSVPTEMPVARTGLPGDYAGQAPRHVRFSHGDVVPRYLNPSVARSPSLWNRLGFEWYAGPQPSWPQGSGPTSEWGVAAPHWVVVMWTAIFPAFVLSGARRRRRRRSLGRCPSCGYDLRASPDRCPECGTPVPRRKEGSAV